MNSYEFAGLPSTSSVAAAVTFSVCAWFLAAAGAMFVDAPAEATPAAAPTPVVYTAPAVAIAPEARLIIVVEARRA